MKSFARLTSLAATALLAGGVVLAAAPAQAALSDCAGGQQCGWAYNDYSDVRWASGSGIWTLTAGQSDVADSFANRGNRDCAETYEHFGYTGKVIGFNRPGLGGTTRDPNLSNGGGQWGNTSENWANRITSVEVFAC